MNTPRTALAGGGGLLAAIAFVLGGAVGDSTDFVNPPQPVNEVVALAVAPPLKTAFDICNQEASTFARFPLDGHYEGQLTVNPGQLNQVRYHLFFREDLRLDVVIEESRAGEPTIPRPDPNTQQFLDCVLKEKTVKEVIPTQ